jgi:hypothetical protein
MIDRRLISALVLLTLGGCAELTVRVDILNPMEVHRITDNARMTVLYYEVARSTEASIHEQVEALWDRQRKAYAGLAAACLLAAGKPGVTEPARELLQSRARGLQEVSRSGSPIYGMYVKYREALLEQARRVRAAAGKNPFDEHGALTEPVMAALRVRQTELDRLQVEIFKNIDAATSDQSMISASLSGGGSQEVQALVQEQKTQVRDAKLAFDTITGGRSLSASEYAFAVASARDQAWKPSFNEATGVGAFGNSEIVIKVDKAGEFTVKGMQFDPGTIAAVASKVTTQSLLMAAKLAGAPVAAPAVSEASKSPGPVDAGEADVARQSALLTRSAGLSAREQAIRGLAETILAAEDDLDSDARRDSADKAIKDHFEAYSDIIRLKAVE